MALSGLTVRQAKAAGTYSIPSLDGLALAVTAAGGRTWLFCHYWAGKQKRAAVRFADENTLRDGVLRGGEHRGFSLEEGRLTTLSIPQHIFGKDVLPNLGKWPIREIKRPDLLKV